MIYEHFAQGDFTSPSAACDTFGYGVELEVMVAAAPDDGGVEPRVPRNRHVRRHGMRDSDEPGRADAAAPLTTKEERCAALATRKETRILKNNFADISKTADATLGLPINHPPTPPETARSMAAPEAMTERLGAFTETNIGEVRQKLGVPRILPRANLEGCLALLFTSRAGSTCLARELECAFDIGRLRESLRPHRLIGPAAARDIESRNGKWLSFKGGGYSLIAAELCGFFDAYLPVTSFLLLSRRDIVAQAVSILKAKQTGRYHFSQLPKGSPTYDGKKIAEYLVLIADGVEMLRTYARRSGRPCRLLVYEDFAEGDFTSAIKDCEGLGTPRRGPDRALRPARVIRIGDAVNLEWAARFRAEMDVASGRLIDRYLDGFE